MQGKESSAFTAKTSEPPTPVRRPQSAHHSLSCLEKLLITVPQATTSSASSPSRPDLISTSVASLGQAIHAPKSTQKHASSLKHTHTHKSGCRYSVTPRRPEPGLRSCSVCSQEPPLSPRAHGEAQAPSPIQSSEPRDQRPHPF